MKTSIKVSLLATLLIGYQFTIHSTVGMEFDQLISRIKKSQIDLPSKENLTVSQIMKVINQYEKTLKNPIISSYSPNDVVKATIAAITDTKLKHDELATEKLRELERQTTSVFLDMRQNFQRKENDRKLEKESYSYQINQTYNQLKKNIENAYLNSQNQASELYNNPSFTSLGNTLTDPIIASGIAAGTLSLGYIYYLYTKYQAEQERLKQEAQENKDANL